MNEELESALAEMIVSFTEGVQGAAGFAVNQAPDVIQQLLIWKAVESLVFFAAAIVAIGFALRLLLRLPSERSEAVQRAKEAFADGESWTRYSPGSSVTSCAYDIIMATGGTSILVRALFSLVLIIFAAGAINLTWVQIWIAPKVYLLEYAAKLVS